MTLIEAIKSGKKFCRPDMFGVIQYIVGCKELDKLVITYSDNEWSTYQPTISDILYQGWELVKEPCKHEPKKWASKDIPCFVFEMVCYHCNAKIKAKEWIADEN